jgi:hypothetical protein
MFSYFKAQPNEFVQHYVGGKLKSEGNALAFFYFPFNTQVVVVPNSSMDTGLVFNETTSNFQEVTIQGTYTYRIIRPKQAAQLLNFTMDPKSRNYVSNDPDLLPQRLTSIIQLETRAELLGKPLEDVLLGYERLARAVEARVREGKLFEPMGTELVSLYFTSAKLTPEVGKALEAEYRETLLRKQDEAIYARRAAAVAEERKIKENELNTEIALEQQRQILIDLQGANALKEAENEGQALERKAEFQARATQKQIDVYKTLDAPKVLALAMQEMAENAHRIGELTITSEVLANILKPKASD